MKGEVSTLLDDELKELHELSVSLHSMARVQNSINWQKARMIWLQEGDANSNFFHGIMSKRWRKNSINLLMVDGVSVEGVKNIKNNGLQSFFFALQIIWNKSAGCGGITILQTIKQ